MRFLAGRGFAAEVIHQVVGRAHAVSNDPADPDLP
jgi:hypothetical protein